MSYEAFEDHAEEYDAWFDSESGATIFTMELDCLRPLLYHYSQPYLEIGVGSGRFAQALGVEYGVEPSPALLQKAISRGIRVKRAGGEKIPFPDGFFGGVLIALTLCFVDNPFEVLRESSRVLIAEGGLVLGLILKNSPWAEFYAGKAREGHPIYSKAQFFSRDEVEVFLGQAGFEVLQYRSVLFQPLGQSYYRDEHPIDSYSESAGFVAVESQKRQTRTW